jgi:hypothetical protein
MSLAKVITGLGEVYMQKNQGMTGVITMRRIYKMISLIIFCISVHGMVWSQGVSSKTKSRPIQNQAIDGFYLELPTKYKLPDEIQTILMKYVQGNDDFESKYPLYIKDKIRIKSWLISNLSKVMTTLKEKAEYEETMFKGAQADSDGESVGQMEHKRDFYDEQCKEYMHRNYNLAQASLDMEMVYIARLKYHYDAEDHIRMSLSIGKDIATLNAWQG